MHRLWKRISLWWTLPTVIALLLSVFLSYFPWVTEYVFSRGLFRVVSVPLGWLTSLLPFSLTELLVVAAFPLFVFLIILLIRRWRRTASRRAFAQRLLRGVAWTASLLFALYMLMHGLNFYRVPAAELMALDTRPQDAAFLQKVCIDLAETASAARAELALDGEGHIVEERSTGELLRQATAGYAAAQEDYPFLWGSVWNPKSVRLSHLWSYTGITGMYFPFFAEANVNTDVPLFNYPATAAHELAHTRGFAREDECNFFAFLTCRYQEDALFRYSGHLLAYIYCENALSAYDQELAWEVRETACSAGMRQDLTEQRTYWKQFEGEVQEVSTQVNDTFLTVQGQDDGVLSYDRVVELILAYYYTVVWGDA